MYDILLNCPAAQPLLLISHKPKQNQAEGGTAKIKINPTQLSEQMDHPVVHIRKFYDVIKHYLTFSEEGFHL